MPPPSKTERPPDRFEVVFHKAPLVMALSTVDEGRFIDVNERFCSTLHYSREDVVGRTSTELGILAFPRRVILQAIRENGGLGDFEGALRARDGRIVDVQGFVESVELHGRRVLLTVMVDITERKRIEATLLLSEKKFSEVFRLNPAPMAITRLRDGRLIEFNLAAERFFEYTGREALDHSSIELEIWVNPADRAEVIRELDATGSVYNREYRFQSKHGRPLVALYSAILIELGDEKCAMSLFMDITELKRTEEALREAKAEAQSADRIKSEFLDIAAHELRTPLTSLMLLNQINTGLVAAGTPIPVTNMERVTKQIDRLAGLVDDLLNVAKIERGMLSIKVAPVDLVSIVSGCVEEIQRRAPQRRLTFESATSRIVVDADEERIHQVVANLLDNALKYTPDHTVIEVKISIEDDRVRVAVKDHGPGIPAQYQKKLFTEFSRVHTGAALDHAGLGLGLFICRRIMDLHGGTIGVSSEVGAGSTFYFELTRDEGPR